MRNLFTLVICILITTAANAQINGPDTVCMGAIVNYTTSALAKSYTWSSGNLNTSPAIGTYSLVANYTSPSNAYISGPPAADMVVENGNYYLFVANDGGGINRLDFGPNPNSVPTGLYMSGMGTFGYLSDIEMVKDDATGNWYAFLCNTNRLIRLEFGTNITNVYTTHPLPYALTDDKKQFVMKKQGSTWVGFTVDNDNNKIVKMDFGNSPANTPVLTTYSDLNHNMISPIGIAFHEQNGNHYALIVQSGLLTRLSFGNSLLNTPTFSTISSSTLASTTANATAITILNDCNKTVALITTNWRNMAALDFGNDITSSPIVNNLGMQGPAGSDIQGIAPYIYNGNLEMMVMSSDEDKIYNCNVVAYPSNTITSYSPTTFSTSFSTTGVNVVSIITDAGLATGSSSFCKEVFVRSAPIATIVTTATTLSSSTTASSYQWFLNNNPIQGATNQTYTPTQTGSYSLTITDSYGCIATSAIVNFTIGVNVPSIQKANKLHIFPNPSTGSFAIQSDGIISNKAVLKCYNALGILVYSDTLLTANGKIHSDINLDNLAKGIYNIRLELDNRIISAPLLLQ